jgi:hypothetical protein
MERKPNSLKKVGQLGIILAKITEQEGSLRLEREIHEILERRFPESFPMPKNMILFLNPSKLSFQFLYQIAVMVQLWYIQRSKPKFFLFHNGKFQFMDWSNKYETYSEIVKALWAIHIESIKSPLSLMMETIPLPSSKETVEKMTCIILSDYDKIPVHDLLLQRQQILPHMVYIDTSIELFLNYDTPEITKTFPCRVFQDRCTILSASEDGITVEQWKQINLKSYSSELRNSTCWDFLNSVLEVYRPMLDLINIY